MSSTVTVVHKWQNRGVLFLIGAAVCGCLLYWILQSWFRLNGTLESEPENLQSVSGLILGLVIELVIGVGSLTVTAGGFAWWLIKDLGFGVVDGFTTLRGSPNETKQIEAALSDSPAFTSIAPKAATQATTAKIDERKLAGILKSILTRLDKLDPPPPPPPSVEELQAEIDRLREQTKAKPATRKAVS
jgi:hypothetical protein